MVRHRLSLFFINTAESQNLRTAGVYKTMPNDLGARMLALDGLTLRDSFCMLFKEFLKSQLRNSCAVLSVSHVICRTL